MDSIAVLTEPLDAPAASCLGREVHQDDSRVTGASLFVSLLQRDGVFPLGQSLDPFSFAVLPASLETLLVRQGLVKPIRTWVELYMHITVF